jgi:hypothetical protein
MNAGSTLTHLLFIHHVAAPGQAQRSVNSLQEALAGATVDKILTRLPSNRSVSYYKYQNLLLEWSPVLRPTGSTLDLLVDVPNALDALKQAVQHLSEMYSIAFIRSPSITFGNHRCTLVIVRHDASRGRDIKKCKAHVWCSGVQNPPLWGCWTGNWKHCKARQFNQAMAIFQRCGRKCGHALHKRTLQYNGYLLLEKQKKKKNNWFC